MTYTFRFDVVWDNLGFLLSGLGMTLLLSVVALVVSTIGGLICAGMALSRWSVLRAVNLAYGEVIRNTPLLVQLFWIYYVIPVVFHIRITAFWAVLVGLSIYSTAFLSEVFRAGIQAVPQGQREAAAVIGLSRVATFTKIIMPQALSIVMPALALNFVSLIKYSSFGSVFSVAEITRQGIMLSSSTFRPLEIFSVIGLMYFVICWPLTTAIRIWERRLRTR